MLSAHGVNANDAETGPHGVGLEHAAAPAQINAEELAQKKSGGDDAEVETTSPATSASFSTTGQSDSSSILTGTSSNQPVSLSPAHSSDNTEHSSNPITDHSGNDHLSSDDAHSSMDVVVVEIVFVDPLPSPSGTTSNFTPGVVNSTGGNGFGNGWMVHPGGEPTGGVPTSVGQGTVPQLGGAIGSDSQTGANQPSGQTNGHDSHSGDDESRDADNTSGVGFRPLLLHAGEGVARNPGGDQTDGGTQTPAIIRNDNPGSSPAVVGPSFVSQIIPITPSVTPQAVPSALVAVTPLALTPAREIGAPTSANHSTTTLDVAPVSIAGHDLIVTSARSTTTDSSSPIIRLPGQIAAVVPPFAVMRTIGAVPAAARAVADQIADAVPLVASANPITAQSIEQSLPAQVAYNFIRFDAAVFHDAVSVFAADLASLTTPTAARHSTARAWIITGTVLGLDAVFLTYWHQKTRKEKRAKLSLARIKSDPRKRRSPQD